MEIYYYFVNVSPITLTKTALITGDRSLAFVFLKEEWKKRKEISR